MVIYFIQLFAIVYSCNIEWPATFQVIVKYLTISNLSLEVVTLGGIPTPIYVSWSFYCNANCLQYAKYSLIMTLPLLFMFLFLIPIKKSHWDYLLSPAWKFILALFGVLTLWVIGYAFSFLFGFVAYSDSFTQMARGQLPPMEVWYIAIIFGSVVTVIFLIWLASIILFKIKGQDDAFWYHYYTKYRQRIALFLLVISYFPVLRELAVTYQCEPYAGYRSNGGFQSLLLYTDQVCPNSISNAPPMYYISAAFALFYCIIVPITMIVLIAIDSRKITKLYGIDNDWKDYKESKKLFNKQKKQYTNEEKKIFNKRFKQRYEDIVEKYTDNVKHHSSATSILYASYKSFMRFYRVFQLYERVILCCLAAFMYSDSTKTSQAPVVGSVIFVYGALSLILRPYRDPLHTLVDVTTHAVMVVTTFIGYAGSAISDLVSSIILYVINSLNLILLVIVIFVHPIRTSLNKKHLAKKQEERIAQLRMSQQEVNYCHYTLDMDEQRQQQQQLYNTVSDDEGYMIDTIPAPPLANNEQKQDIQVVVSAPPL
jgi:hypothetical protein